MAAVKKKYKIFKICKELNLASETIINFLDEKGIKVSSGPNASVPEDVYVEILERFATDKEKAERLKARRQSQSEKTPEQQEAEIQAEAKEDSAYLKALRQSIEQGVEALSRSQEEEEKRKKEAEKAAAEKTKAAKQAASRKAAEKAAQEEAEAEKERVEARKKKEKEEAEAKKDKKEAKETDADRKKTKKKKEEEPAQETKEAAEAEKAPQLEEETEQEKESKTKKKDKKKKKEEEEEISEKERKRRKAMEMIRKEKDSRRAAAKTESDEEGKKKKRRGKKQKKRSQVDLKEVQDTVKKTLASMETKGRKPKKQKKTKSQDEEREDDKVIKVTEFISASELANLMDVSVAEIITKCLEMGLVVSINQRLDIDTITLLAEEYGFHVEEQYVNEFVEEEEEEEEEIKQNEEDLTPRAPIVTIMGHVDHGKTSLLDQLRRSNIVGGEAGGITQHVGAYEVEYEGKRITFLDTPGHEAFTAMRARGAQVTDVVILIIAADDAVMPQTVEALDHAKAAGVKIVIAINKIDKPNANSERIKQQLAERDVLVEDWGGSYQCAELSAKSGEGISELLEKVLLEAEMLELKANANKYASGVVIESRLDRGKGPIATVLVEDGTLKVGDNFVAGNQYGKVRALLNEREERLDSVGPAQPALVIGFTGVAQAGDRLIVMADEKKVKEISNKRQQLKREQDAKQVKMMTLDQISEQIKTGEVEELPVLIKADVDGSAEAIADALFNLNTDEVRVNVVRKAVGPISESDVLLASASGAVIIGFHVRANPQARELATQESVDIRIYRVIYDAINDIKMALEGLLEPSSEEHVVGAAEVRETFKISRIGTIAGCYVTQGKIKRNNQIRVVRDDVEIYDGSIASLKRFKEDTREVASGFECGIQVDNFNDIKVGDVIEAYEMVEVKRHLE